MRKSDKSIHNISVASIKRSTIEPYNFKWTKFYESNTDFQYSGIKIQLTHNELIICSTVIDSENYSILTTQKLITNEKGNKSIGDLNGSKLKQYGDFKGLHEESNTFGIIQLANNTELKYFIETGKASMIMIYGIRTLIRTQNMTDKNIENVTRIWKRQNEK